MRDGSDLQASGGDRTAAWIVILGAVAGAAGVYFLATDRGRQWLRDLPETGRGWAAAVRQAMSLIREISEQVEQSVQTFEQALGRVEESIAARESGDTALAA